MTETLCVCMCVCVCVSPEALQLQREALWIKHGCHSEELEDLMRSLEQWGDARVDQHNEVKQQGAFLSMESGWDLTEHIVCNNKLREK